MLFNSYIFVFLFLPFVLLGYYILNYHHFTTYANRYIDAKAAVSVPL